MKDKFKYFFKVYEGYCASSITKQYLQPHEASSGCQIGEGWGATPKQAKSRAYASLRTEGNVNIEWVLSIRELYENGKLIQKWD